MPTSHQSRHKLDFENSRRNSFVASTAVNSRCSEREGGFASHPHPGTYATSKQNVQFLIYRQNFSAAKIQCAHALVLM